MYGWNTVTEMTGASCSSARKRAIRYLQERLCNRFSQEELEALSRLQGKMLENLSALRERDEKEDSKS